MLDKIRNNRNVKSKAYPHSYKQESVEIVRSLLNHLNI